MEQHLLELLSRWGPLAVLVGYFVWRDHIREQRMAARLKELEEYEKAALTQLIREIGIVVEKNGNLMHGLIVSLQSRPCIAEDMKRVG